VSIDPRGAVPAARERTGRLGFSKLRKGRPPTTDHGGTTAGFAPRPAAEGRGARRQVMSSPGTDTTQAADPHLGRPVPLNVITTPGTYVCNWSGHLLRVSPAAVTARHEPAMNIIGTEPLMVTKISDDPELPLRAAKRVAQQYRIPTHF
jgi:hypothetical protein